MLPAGKTILPGLAVTPAARASSKTYRVDWDAGRIAGTADGLEAMEQAVRKALNTRRFRHLIYSWNYGTEWDAVIGKSRAVAESELKRVLEEALGQDERITEVAEVSLVPAGRRSCTAAVRVETIFGAVREERTFDV